MKHNVKAFCVALLLTATPALAAEPFTELKVFDITKADGSFEIFLGYYKDKKSFDEEGMQGFEVNAYTIGQTSKQKSKEIDLVVTCHGSPPSVIYGGELLPVDQGGPYEPPEYINPELINKGLGSDKDFYYDLWWSICKNVNKKFTSN